MPRKSEQQFAAQISLYMINEFISMLRIPASRNSEFFMFAKHCLDFWHFYCTKRNQLSIPLTLWLYILTNTVFHIDPPLFYQQWVPWPTFTRSWGKTLSPAHDEAYWLFFFCSTQQNFSFFLVCNIQLIKDLYILFFSHIKDYKIHNFYHKYMHVS